MKVFRACLLLLLLFPGLAMAGIEVLGLFKDAALLKKDGKQKLVKVGEEWNGVLLLKADAKSGVAQVDGKRVQLSVSSHIGTNFVEPAKRSIIIRKNADQQYITTAAINGRRTRVIVDTGANVIALNASHASSMGVNMEGAPKSLVQTASGVVEARSVMLDQVEVGGIEIRQVQATVLDGAHPDTILLGVSYLQHVHIQEKDGVMTLTARY